MHPLIDKRRMADGRYAFEWWNEIHSFRLLKSEILRERKKIKKEKEEVKEAWKILDLAEVITKDNPQWDLITVEIKRNSLVSDPSIHLKPLDEWGTVKVWKKNGMD